MTIQVSIFEQLIALVPDPMLAEQLRTRYYEDLRAQTSFVQSRMGHLEIDLREQIQQSLGVTNDMISATQDAVEQGTQRQEAAVLELRIEFHGGIQAIGESVTGLRADLDDLRTRDARQYEDSLRTHAEIQARQDHTDAALDRLAARSDVDHDRLASLEARLSARPTPEQAKATYDGVREIQAQYDEIQAQLTHIQAQLGLDLDESEA